MAESARPSPGRIFISYRQEETAYAAGWLFDRLAVRFGREVFKDVDSIEPGENWVEVITRVVGSCDALLALIGNEWFRITDDDGRRRLDDPDDFVRLEIEAALKRNVRVIPILVAGARMPRAAELPSSLAGLTQRQALVLSPANFDTSRLVRVLDQILAEVRASRPDAAAISPPADKAPDRSATELPEAAPNPDTDEAGSPPDEGRPRDKPRYRRSRRVWMILAGAGVALLLLGGVIVVYIDQGAGDQGAGVQGGAGDHGAGSVIFEDDFSSEASGWMVCSESGIGLYQDGAYHLAARAKKGSGIVPVDASSVYPSAPSSIKIRVETNVISSDARYGIFCRRTHNSWYAFVVTGESVLIYRHEGPGPPLDEEPVQVDVDATNTLTAICKDGENDEGQPDVHLRLLVNGQTVTKATDPTPLPPGTITLFVDGRHQTTTTKVQFDNVVITQV